MELLNRLVQAVDEFQQRHRWLAFPFAVVKKFGDDQAGRHAALLAYYGFFCMFPLLLVAVTVIGFLLQGRSDLADRIVDSAATQFPIIGTSIAKTVEGSHLRGSGLAPLPLGRADEQVLEDLAKQEERRPEQRVEVSFDADPEGRGPPAQTG